MKWKNDFMRSATGQLGIYSDNECRRHLLFIIECLDDLLDAIEADDIIKQLARMHINWLNEE